MISNWFKAETLKKTLVSLLGEVGDLAPPPHIDYDLLYWPTGASRVLFWVLRELGEDVCCGPTCWVWNTGQEQLSFALDWSDVDKPIILEIAP